MSDSDSSVTVIALIWFLQLDIVSMQAISRPRAVCDTTTVCLIEFAAISKDKKLICF